MISSRYLLCSFVFCLICNANYAQSSIPFREASTYKFELDYNFKAKPPPTKDHILLEQPQKSHSQGVLPYVMVKFTLVEVMEDDYRIKVVNNKGQTVLNKRIKEPMEVKIDLGFAEDLKDKTTPYLFYVYYLSKEKDIHSQIKLEVEESGSLLLNDEIHGKL